MLQLEQMANENKAKKEIIYSSKCIKINSIEWKYSYAHPTYARRDGAVFNMEFSLLDNRIFGTHSIFFLRNEFIWSLV